MSMLATTVGLGLGAWAIGLGGAALAQRRLIFRPPVRVRGLPPGPHAGGSRIEPLSLRCADGALLQGWRSTPLDTPPQGWLLYFGGRGEDVAWAPLMSSYLGSWAVVAFNYRGFGGSTGRATEPLVMRDARCLHARFIPAGMPRVLMGRSLGTAVALRLAAEVAHQRGADEDGQHRRQDRHRHVADALAEHRRGEVDVHARRAGTGSPPPWRPGR
jgi:hypothetical protein